MFSLYLFAAKGEKFVAFQNLESEQLNISLKSTIFSI